MNFLLFFLWRFGTEKTSAYVYFKHKIFWLFLVWLNIKLIDAFWWGITWKGIWLLKIFLTLAVFYLSARKVKVFLESERFSWLLVERVKMALIIMLHGVERNVIDLKTRSFITTFIKDIQIKITIFDKGSGIIIVIIIYHYWGGFDLSQINIV